MQRISEVLNEESDLHNPADPVFEVKDGRIEFKNVEFAYKKDSKEPVLTDINLKIRSGETIGIIGGTGSAKTSLVNLVSRLYDVTKGEVLVGGRFGLRLAYPRPRGFPEFVDCDFCFVGRLSYRLAAFPAR